MLTAVTGVAGSGKSSLIEGVFLPDHPEAIVIDQSPVGTTSRGNPATYSGVMDELRKAFAAANKVDAGLFSFNSKGACETCNGTGVIYTDLAFLDGVRTPCEACGGRRFKDEVLAYTLDGRNVSEVLAMTVAEALEAFDRREIARRLQAMSDVGLDYLTLGQPLSTLSGGECQRLKLASELHRQGNVYVLDEPTTGLHMSDTGHAARDARPARRRREHRHRDRAQPRRDPERGLDHRPRARGRLPRRPCCCSAARPASSWATRPRSPRSSSGGMRRRSPEQAPRYTRSLPWTTSTATTSSSTTGAPTTSGCWSRRRASFEGANPLCGDRITMQLTVDDGVVTEVGFTGRGCAISQASASLLTDEIKGKPVGDVAALRGDGPAGPAGDRHQPGAPQVRDALVRLAPAPARRGRRQAARRRNPPDRRLRPWRKSYEELLREARTEIPEVTAAEADALRRAGGVVLVDVREPHRVGRRAT